MSVSLVLVSAVWLGAVPGGCGRLGLDAQEIVSDAPPACPAGTTELAPGSAVCIETDERANLSWIEADEACRAAGRRMCADAEWALACTAAAGLVHMTDDWEWVAENDGTTAQKRGGDGACKDMASHEIDSGAYDFRCCVEKS